MSEDKFVKMFDEMGGSSYDSNNANFLPFTTNLHFLHRLILMDLPSDARILCVGVGTGADIIYLAHSFSNWTFVGIDPSQSMLDTCQEKLSNEHILDRCELFNGYLSDYNSDHPFDAVLCLFVMHFIQGVDNKRAMYSHIFSHLKPNGVFISAEICVDTSSKMYPSLLENWKTLHKYSGAPSEKLTKMADLIEHELAVISPEETDTLIESSGLSSPIQYFQGLLIRGCYSIKTRDDSL